MFEMKTSGEGHLQAGLPNQEELIEATLDYQLDVSGGDLRKFILDSVAELDLGDKAGVNEIVTQLTEALDKAENQHGSPIDNEVALSAFQASVRVSLPP